MKKLLRLAKKSAKENFRIIKEKGEFDSPFFETPIKITRLFLNHIIYQGKRNRNEREIIERILIIPFLEKIIQNGHLTETRKKKDCQFFSIDLQEKSDIFSVIILQTPKSLSLLSCFRKYKKDLS